MLIGIFKKRLMSKHVNPALLAAVTVAGFLIPLGAFTSSHILTSQSLMVTEAVSSLPDGRTLSVHPPISFSSGAGKPHFDYFVLSLIVAGVAIAVMLFLNTQINRRTVQLRDSETRFSNIFKNVKDAIYIESTTGEILDVNPAVCKMLGYSPAEITRMYVHDIVPPEIAASLPKEIQKETVSDGVYIETENVRKDGSRIPVEVSSSLVEISGKKRVIAIVRDIIERKATKAELERLVAIRTQDLQEAIQNLEKAKAELEEKNIELLKLDKMKSEFISIVSHELRTPLTSIREGASQVFDRLLGEINQEQAEALAIVIEEIDRLARIINNVLDISRIESGRVVLQKTFMDFAKLLERKVSQFQPEAGQKHIRLDVKVKSVPSRIYADSDKLEQILFNLIGNAVKFTPEGGAVTVEASGEKGYVQCSVSDNGVGIAPAAQSRIFEKFTQFFRSPGGGARGTGLGLAITKLLVEMHGGRIWAESELDAGSRFTFKIPDHRSRDSLQDYLQRRLGEANKGGTSLSLVGIRLDGFRELKEKMGEKFKLFFEKMSWAVGSAIDHRTDIWALEDSGEWVSIIEGEVAEKVPGGERGVLRKLNWYRYLYDKKPVNPKVCVASACSPQDASDAIGLLKVLSERLKERSPFQLGLAKKRVLVVDDESELVEYLSEVLRRNQMEPLGAFSGEEALEIAERESPDLILLDMVLPGISGYEVISRLKQKEFQKDIPLISLSAYTIDREKLKQVAGQTVPTLDKPLDTERLLKSIEQTWILKEISV